MPGRSDPERKLPVLGYRCGNCSFEWRHGRGGQCPNCRTIFSCVSHEVLS